MISRFRPTKDVFGGKTEINGHNTPGLIHTRVRFYFVKQVKMRGTRAETLDWGGNIIICIIILFVCAFSYDLRFARAAKRKKIISRS